MFRLAFERCSELRGAAAGADSADHDGGRARGRTGSANDNRGGVLRRHDEGAGISARVSTA